MTPPPAPPFIAEPIEGWRVWLVGVDPKSQDPLLLPAGLGRGAWPARRAFQAACYASRPVSTRHRPPTVTCTCGVYASDSLRSFLRAGGPMHASVIGQVSLWGKVIEHERGWRAKYAYPSRLRLICAVCLQRGSGEATPYVVHAAAPRILIAACRWHRDEIPHGASLDPDDVQAALLSAYAVDVLPVESLHPRFSFPQPAPTRYQLGWPAIEELRALSRDVPSSTPATPEAGGVPSVAAPATGAPAPRVVPAPAARPAPAVRRSTATAPEPLAIRALKAVGVGIGWLLQAAFFLLLFFVGCADTFQVVSVQP